MSYVTARPLSDEAAEGLDHFLADVAGGIPPAEAGVRLGLNPMQSESVATIHAGEIAALKTTLELAADYVPSPQGSVPPPQGSAPPPRRPPVRARHQDHPTVRAQTEERPPEVKDRTCLKCRRDFRSRHIGERVCEPCKATDAWRYGELVAV